MYRFLSWALDICYSFNKHSNLTIELLILLPFFWWTKYWALEGLHNLPKVIVRGGPETWTLTIWYQRLIFKHSATSEEHTSTGLRGVLPKKSLETWKEEANVATRIWKRDLVSEQPRSSITTKILKCPVNQLSDSGRNLKVMDLGKTMLGGRNWCE